MKKMFKFGCLGIIAIIIVFAIIGIATNDTDSSPASTNNKGSDKASTPSKNEKKLKTIGESLKVGDVVFKVNKISTTKEIKDAGGYLSYKPEADGSIFFIANISVKNTGKEAITTDSSFFILKKGKLEYAPSTMITTDKKFFLFDSINPGLTQTGNVLFEIPEKEKNFILNVQTGIFGTEQGEIKLY